MIVNATMQSKGLNIHANEFIPTESDADEFRPEWVEQRGGEAMESLVDSGTQFRVMKSLDLATSVTKVTTTRCKMTTTKFKGTTRN